MRAAEQHSWPECAQLGFHPQTTIRMRRTARLAVGRKVRQKPRRVLSQATAARASRCWYVRSPGIPVGGGSIDDFT
jgi:hypothetical protein